MATARLFVFWTEGVVLVAAARTTFDKARAESSHVDNSTRIGPHHLDNLAFVSKQAVFVSKLVFSGAVTVGSTFVELSSKLDW